MMNYFGYRCLSCNTSIKIGVGPADQNGEPLCPQCHKAMLPDASLGNSAANVFCPKCSLVVGLVTSDKCPQCGGDWQALK